MAKLISYRKNLPSTAQMVSNRLPEKIEEYHTVPVDNVKRYEELITKASTLHELVKVLEEMSENFIAIAGTRGHLYRAEAMLDLVEDIRDLGYNRHIFKQITRTLGLRGKVYDLLLINSRET